MDLLLERLLMIMLRKKTGREDWRLTHLEPRDAFLVRRVLKIEFHHDDLLGSRARGWYSSLRPGNKLASPMATSIMRYSFRASGVVPKNRKIGTIVSTEI